MKLTRHEILLVGALLLALVVGGLVKRFRTAHPVLTPPANAILKK